MRSYRDYCLIAFQLLGSVVAYGQPGTSALAVEIRTADLAGSTFPVDLAGRVTSLTDPHPKRLSNRGGPDLNQPQVEALRVKARFIDPDQVDVEVSVLLPNGPPEKNPHGFTPAGLPEKSVGHARLRLGEESSFSQVALYGLVPVVARIVSNLPPSPRVTPVTDETGVLTLVSINELRDDVVLTIQNTSSKDIWALDIVVNDDSGQFFGQTTHAPRGHALIAAGGVLKSSVNVRPPGKDSLDSRKPAHAFLRAVLFTDDSFAGESVVAADILGTRFGETMQKKRVLDGLNAILASGATDEEMLAQFERTLEGLPTIFTATELSDALARTSFAEMKEQEALGRGIVAGLKGIRGHLRNEMTKYRRSKAADNSLSFASFWLESTSNFVETAPIPN